MSDVKKILILNDSILDRSIAKKFNEFSDLEFINISDIETVHVRRQTQQFETDSLKTGAISAKHDVCQHEQGLLTDVGDQINLALIHEIECKLSESTTVPSFYENFHNIHILWNRFKHNLQLKEVSMILFLDLPNGLNQAILYQLAKALRISVLFLVESPTHCCFFSFRDLADYGCHEVAANSFKIIPKVSKRDTQPNNYGCADIVNKSGIRLTSNLKRFIQSFWFLLKKRPTKLLNPLYFLKCFTDFNDRAWLIEQSKDPYSKFFGRKRLDYFDFLTSKPDISSLINHPYVLFVLQSPIELQTELLLNNQFSDQLLAIEQLAHLVPNNYKILVTDDCTFNQSVSPMFFHRFSRIKNTYYLPNNLSVPKLLDKSKFIATINSNRGWNALSKGKKVLLFGKPWYWKLPGAYTYHDNFDINEITCTDDFDMEKFRFQTKCLLSVAICGNFKADSIIQPNKASKGKDKSRLAITIYNLLIDEVAPTSFMSTNPAKQ